MIANPPATFYTPHPRQYEALRLLGLTPNDPPPDKINVNELLFGGSVGGGKSALLRMVAVFYALMNPGSRIAIFRRNWGELKQNHVEPFLTEIGTGKDAPGEFNWTNKEYRFHNGSIIEFHHCEQDNDYLGYYGFEWDVVLFDEATKFPTAAILFISSRCRSVRPGWQRRIIYASNPLGPAHQYLKLNFYEPGQDVEAFWVQVSADGVRFRRAFLRSRIEDNYSWPDPNAIRAGVMAMEEVDPLLARAQLDGDWDTESGNFFADFNRKVHVVEPFEIPSHWPCWRALDWGGKAPAACLWFAKDIDAAYPRVYVYREWLRAEVPTQLQARMILKLSEDDPHIRATYLDPSCWGKRNGPQGPTHYGEYYTGGLHDLVKGFNRRPEGWARVNRALLWGRDRETPPELQIFSGCRELIKELANAQRDEGKENDIIQPKNYTDLRDDALDASRYGLAAASVKRTPPSPKPKHYGFATSRYT